MNSGVETVLNEYTHKTHPTIEGYTKIVFGLRTRRADESLI